MIIVESVLDVCDNSGAKKVKCIKVPGGSKKRFAGIGDTIVCSVQSVAPKNSKVKKGEVVFAVITSTKYGINREDGSRTTFEKNNAVLINKQKEMIGTRITSPVCDYLKSKGFGKIVSLSKEGF